MRENKEIVALLKLIDDPDDEVFDTVSEKLLHYGKDIIPNLEQLWELTQDAELQERIEKLIHRVHFQDLQKEMLEWSRSKNPELLKGAIIVSKYQYPELDIPSILASFDQIRRSIWLELNSFLTPLEHVNIFNNLFYGYFKLQGNELTKREAKHFFINILLETKQGNTFTLGVIWMALAEQLDVPIFAMDIPRQFILAYIDTLYHFHSTEAEGVEQIQFFIDPLNGMVYTQKDVDTYLDKIKATERETYFTPMTNTKVIVKLLEELSLCFVYNKEDAKADEIKQLIQIIESSSYLNVL